MMPHESVYFGSSDNIKSPSGPILAAVNLSCDPVGGCASTPAKDSSQPLLSGVQQPCTGPDLEVTDVTSNQVILVEMLVPC
jgi:hypothetical protein